MGENQRFEEWNKAGLWLGEEARLEVCLGNRIVRLTQTPITLSLSLSPSFSLFLNLILIFSFFKLSTQLVTSLPTPFLDQADRRRGEDRRARDRSDSREVAV